MSDICIPWPQGRRDIGYNPQNPLPFPRDAPTLPASCRKIAPAVLAHCSGAIGDVEPVSWSLFRVRIVQHRAHHSDVEHKVGKQALMKEFQSLLYLDRCSEGIRAILCGGLILGDALCDLRVQRCSEEGFAGAT